MMKSAILCSLAAISVLFTGCTAAGPGDVLAKADEAFENGKYYQARRKYSVAVESLNPQQEMNMGWMYYTGSGAPRNLKKAIAWYDQAAGTGSPEAMYALGEVYEKGPAAVADENKAAVLYYKAAGAGNADAMLALGGCYENGTGVDSNIKEAVYWFEKAAGEGNQEAMLNLARIYESDALGKPDAAAAAKWRTLAEEKTE